MTPYTLDYNMCTPSELRDFIRNRTSLTPAESEVLRDYRKSHLVVHLLYLDQNATFRFLDLLPELRLEIYRYVLVGRKNWALRAPDRPVDPAILRTCKAVFTEAEPVLYGDNDFTVDLNINTGKLDARSGRYMSKCHSYHYTAVARPGRFEPYVYSREDDNNYRTLSTHLASVSCFEMLRRVRHLSLVLNDCTLGVQDDIAALCMMLSGTTMMKRVTLVFQRSHTDVDVRELARICWPIVFLHAEVELMFAVQDPVLKDHMVEILEALYAEMQKYWEALSAKLDPKTKPPGDLIARARALAALLLQQHNNHWRYLQNTDLMLSELVRCIGAIRTSWTFDEVRDLMDAWEVRDFMDAWKNLKRYVNEDDRTLQSLAKAWKDIQWSPRSFSSCYAEVLRCRLARRRPILSIFGM
jgi:hypothetical protein